MGNELHHHSLLIQWFHTSKACDHNRSDCLHRNCDVAHGNLQSVTMQTLPSPFVIMKAICAGLGWIWLATLSLYTKKGAFFPIKMVLKGEKLE